MASTVNVMITVYNQRDVQGTVLNLLDIYLYASGE